VNFVDWITGYGTFDNQIRARHAGDFWHFSDERNAIDIHASTVRDSVGNSIRYQQQNAINFHLLSDVVLSYACVLAAVFLLDVRNVHMRDDVVVNGYILSDEKARAFRNLRSRRFIMKF
jgi:hypothetical protein